MTFDRRFHRVCSVAALTLGILVSIRVPAQMPSAVAQKIAAHKQSADPSLKTPTAPALRMRSNPAFDAVKKMQQHRMALGASPRRLARPLDEAPLTVNYPGFVQAPYTADRLSTNTNQVTSSVTADFNGDGKPDVATLQNDGTINVLLSPANGTLIDSGLTYTTTVGAPTEGLWLEAVDMNGDGKPDLVAVVTNENGGISGFGQPGRPRHAVTPAPADDFNQAGTYVFIFLNDGTGNFAAPSVTSLQNTAYTTDATVWNVAVGDVNGDGKPDLVVISDYILFNYTDFSVQDITIDQSYLNAGDGTLQVPTTEADFAYNDWLQPENLQAQLVDMNHDGKLDLVTVVAPNGATRATTLQVQLGNGDGTFAALSIDLINNAASAIPFYNGGVNLEVADLNQDGFPDLILGSNSGSTPGQVYVAMNNGDGTISTPSLVVDHVDYPFLSGITVADLNGDGKPDLLVYSDGGVAAYSGKGDGTFSPGPVSQYAAGYSYGLHAAPADFNGDGKVDLIDVDQTQNKLALYAGNGDSTFQGAPALAPPGENASNFQAMASGDFYGTGQMDILGQDWLNMNADYFPDIFTIAPDGQGGLKYVKALTADALDAAAAQYVEPVTADFNGDGANDLLIASAGGLSIAYSQKDGTFAAPTPVNLGATLACTASFADAGDVNGDGYTDIVLAYPGDSYCYGGSTVPSGYFVLLNQHDGTFAPSFTPMGNYLYQPKLVDLNGDGTPDLVIADNDPVDLIFSVTAIPGKGDGTFDGASAAPVLANYQPTSLIAGDFNGDGKQDLAITTGGATDGAGNVLPGYPGVALLAGHGDFTFDAPIFADAGHLASWGAFADLNGDGAPDLVLADIDSSTGEPVSNLVTVLNEGQGQFSAAQESYLSAFNSLSLETYTSYVFVSDLNQDGSPDVVSTGSFNSGLFINAGGVKMTVTLNPAQPVNGSSTTLTATLSSTINASVPGGTVTFLSDGTSLGTGTLSAGVATLDTSALTTGTHTLEVRYGGDATHNGTKADLSVNVLSVAPDFTMSASATSVSLPLKGTGSVTLSFAANATFTGAVQVACSGAPAGVTCTAAPGSVTLSPNGSGTLTVQIAAGSSVTPNNRRGPLGLAALGGPAVALGLLLIVPMRRRSRMFTMWLLALALGTAAALTGCGGGGNKVLSQSNLTITATAGGITKTQTIALTVTRH